ncbi:MAG: CHASE domain-containing protein [Deltaproteobacteria bacterium]|nr:CHASE domain-containing protein [Deltaproteobacteria bacterium]
MTDTMILQGGAGVFASSETVSREEWRAYYRYRQIDTVLPGIHGAGSTEIIEPGELEAHIRRTRAEGFPEYTVRPEGRRDLYTPLLYIEPMDERRRRELGYDLFSSRKTLDLYGRQWTLAVETTPAFESHGDRYTSGGILAAGLLISFLTFLCLWTQGRTNRRAVSLARHMTAALRESEERYRVLNDNLAVGVALIGPDMEVLAANVTKRAWFPDADFETLPLLFGVRHSAPAGTLRGLPGDANL